jgi:hypothetical protein
MSTNERDTHFLGFAKLLADEILPYDGYQFGTDTLQLIAQRAYDLEEHVFNHTTEAMTIFDSFEVLCELNEIPDLTQWPDLPPDAT